MASFNHIKPLLRLDSSVSSMTNDGFEQYYTPDNQLWKMGDDVIDCFQLNESGRVIVCSTIDDEYLITETPDVDFDCPIVVYELSHTIP